MSKRTKPNQRKAHKRFTATAMKTNPKNIAPRPQRGGYRI